MIKTDAIENSIYIPIDSNNCIVKYSDTEIEIQNKKYHYLEQYLFGIFDIIV